MKSLTAFSMKVTTTSRDNGKVNQIVPIMQEHLGCVMNLARIKLRSTAITSLIFIVSSFCKLLEWYWQIQFDTALNRSRNKED